MIARGGLKKALRAMSFAVAWLIVQEELGREPTQAEYSDWWNQSERTTYREMAAWRDCLGEFRTPTGWIAVAGGTADFKKPIPADFAGGIA